MMPRDLPLSTCFEGFVTSKLAHCGSGRLISIVIYSLGLMAGEAGRYGDGLYLTRV